MTVMRGRLHRYEVSDDWERPPDGVSHADVAAVAVDADDRVYLFTRFDHQVIVYEPDGTFVRSWGRDVFTTPHGLTVAPDGTVYCVDAGDHSIRRFTPEGKLLQTIGTPGQPSVRNGGVPFNRCTNLAIGPSGDLYITDGYGNCRVHRFSPSGDLIESWGEPGTGPGQFQLPHGLAIDAAGRVLVADRENDRIQIFTPDGQYVEEWTDVQRPCDLTVAPDGSVYVAELWRPNTTEDRPGRLSIIEPGGKVIERWGDSASDRAAAGNFVAPHGIAMDSRGDVYVAEVTYTFGVKPGRVPPSYGRHQLQKFEGVG